MSSLQIVILVVGGTILFLFLVNLGIAAHYRAKRVRTLRMLFGKDNEYALTEPQVQFIHAYHDVLHSVNDIDRITENDLDLLALYNVTNQTTSLVGDLAYYHHLRSDETFDRSSFEALVQAFSKSEDFRIKTMIPISKIGKSSDMAFLDILLSPEQLHIPRLTLPLIQTLVLYYLY